MDALSSGCTDKHFFTPPVIIKNRFHPASINTVLGLSVKLSFFGHYFGQKCFMHAGEPEQVLTPFISCIKPA